MNDRGRRRRYFAPEVVQTSATDCGPACLKAVLKGYGVDADYERLREACQTDVDGSTIDTLEDIATALGLAAEQVMIPEDHVVLSAGQALPCIAVTRLPTGETHFVVIWRQHGRLFEVMDPATGRRWATRETLLSELYVHETVVPAADWRSWAASDDFLRPLRERARMLGVADSTHTGWVESALLDPSWRALARLDAVMRVVDSLRRSRALRPGRRAARLVQTLLDSAGAAAMHGLLEPYQGVQPVGEPDVCGELLSLRGAVLLRCRGLTKEPIDQASLPVELARVLSERAPGPLKTLIELLGTRAHVARGAMLVGAVAASAAVVCEALLFRSAMEIGNHLFLAEQRFVAGAVMLVFMISMLAIDVSLSALLWQTGRHLEVRMRAIFKRMMPLLPDRHFHSRLASDMAERAHQSHLTRTLPDLAGQALRTSLELLFTACAIAWLDPGAALPALLAATALAAIPLMALPLLQERDLKLRTHSAALTRFNLDALLGAVPIRAHGAQDLLRRAHEGALVDWARAGLALRSTATWIDALQWGVALLMAGWVLFLHADLQDDGVLLLLLYWVFKMPILGQELGALGQLYPGLRHAMVRLLEPFSQHLAADEAPLPEAVQRPDCSAAAGVSLSIDDVTVRVAGHEVLRNVSLQLSAGEQVAVVGPSGAGKSALLGLLLGWHRPASGTVRVDGQVLDERRIPGLRRQTAWVDPAAQLWNASLFQNLRYGTGTSGLSMTEIVDATGLIDLLAQWPDGWGTSLGEGGTLLSGGEGQRVRVARGLARRDAQLVLLDEPFRGLANDERKRLLACVRAHWPRATLLVVTHDLSHTLALDRVIVVERGRLVEDGRPAELARCEGSRYAELLGLDAAAAASLRHGDGWQRLWLEGGTLHGGRTRALAG